MNTSSSKMMQAAEKAALQYELEFYKNLLSKHGKLSPANKKVTLQEKFHPIPDVLPKHLENSTLYRKTGNCSSSLNETFKFKPVTVTGTLPKSSGIASANFHQRTVLQSKCNSNVYKSSVLSLKQATIEPFSSDRRKVLIPSSSISNEINDFQKRTVLYNKAKNFWLGNSKGVLNSSTLPHQSTLNLNKMHLNKRHVVTSMNHVDTSTKSNVRDFKTLPTKKEMMIKARSQKLANEILSVTRQLKKTTESLFASNEKKSSVDRKRKLNKPNSTLRANKSVYSLKKPILVCKEKSEKSNSLKRELTNSQILTMKLPALLSESSKTAIAINTIDKLKNGFESTLVSKAPSTTKMSNSLNLLKVESSDQSALKAISNNTSVSLIKTKDYIGSNSERKLPLSTKQTPENIKNVTKLVESTKVLQPNSMFRTPIRKVKLIRKPYSNIKKNGNVTKTIASKYKVINETSFGANASGSTFSNGVKFISQLNQTNSSSKLTHLNAHIVDKPTSVAKQLSSKYKIVNRVNTPKKLRIHADELYSGKHLKNKHTVLKKKKNYKYVNVNKYTDALRNGSLSQKLVHKKPVILQPRSNLKHAQLNSLVGSKRSPRIYHLNRKSNSPAMKSKFKVVNKPNSHGRKSKRSSLNLSKLLSTQSDVDEDLLLELAAAKKASQSCVAYSPDKSVLFKRIYKSKNTIINRNVDSAQTKMAKMIKTKYSILNKKHVWQKQVSRKFISPNKKFSNSKWFKGQQPNVSLRRITSTAKFYNIRNRRNYPKSQIHNHMHITKFPRTYKGSVQYNMTSKRTLSQQKVFSKTFRNEGKSTPVSKFLASRVLHRSINRVITASAKKSLSKVNTYCMFYNRFGRCNKGLKCLYLHDPSKIAVCTRFLRGTCKIENCPFSHEISPGKMAICSFFLLGTCTKTDCPYRHEMLSPDAKLCKAFVQGSCTKGKQCQDAHVLVCPQYVRGFCEKGTACAFPHPPRKEKRTLPKTAEDPKETEELMDRVLRYFQPSKEQVTTSTSEISDNSVVPRRQQLPEQPSFIALSFSDSES